MEQPSGDHSRNEGPMELDPMPMATGFGDVAANWIESADSGIARSRGVLPICGTTDATSSGTDPAPAQDKPIGWREAMPFLEEALKPLGSADREGGHGGGIGVSPELAERHRAHLIWIGNRLGGPLGELFRLAAERGYAPSLEPDTFVLHPIDRRDQVSLRGWYDAACFSSSFDMTSSLPEITFATTAHEEIAARRFRKRCGEAGLELGREPTGARQTS